MKSILKTLKPEPIANIINGKQTVIVCKNFLKDYVGWVYLCCAKGKPFIYYVDDEVGCVEKVDGEFAFRTSKNTQELNGTVCCRFWCGKVEDIKSQIVNYGNDCLHTTETMNMTELLKTSCLSLKELDSYLGDKNGYAIHISKLEVFEKPRELRECEFYKKFDNSNMCYILSKAPSNYCYIEGEE